MKSPSSFPQTVILLFLALCTTEAHQQQARGHTAPFLAWGTGYPWTTSSTYYHPFLHWSLFYQLPAMLTSAHRPLLPWRGAAGGNEAENRLFPSYYSKTDIVHGARHRLFPFHPSQDLIATRAEHRSIPTTATITTSPSTTTITTTATAQSEAKRRTKQPLVIARKQHKEAKPKKVPALLIQRRRRSSLNSNYPSTSATSVIFPQQESSITGQPHSSSSFGLLSTGSNSQATSGSSDTALKAEDKKLSTAGKFVLGGLSMLESILSPHPPLPPMYHPLLASSSLPPSPSLLPPSPSLLPPSYPPFLFPGPSAMYPSVLPAYPLPAGHNNYYPVSGPYQALSVDSLLIPLVGLVGLSLLIPDIVKTRREGRPSDIGGLDVYRHLSQDDECLRRLACEAGVTVSDYDDIAAVQRALDKALAAKRFVPEYHVTEHQEKVIQSQCGRHLCDAWNTNSEHLKTSVSTRT